MDQRILDIADHLLLIERELHVQGWWSEQPPSPEALASTVPFAVDSMNFDQWLQWIFLPRMKVILENGLALQMPPGSWSWLKRYTSTARSKAASYAGC